MIGIDQFNLLVTQVQSLVVVVQAIQATPTLLQVAQLHSVVASQLVVHPAPVLPSTTQCLTIGAVSSSPEHSQATQRTLEETLTVIVAILKAWVQGDNTLGALG